MYKKILALAAALVIVGAGCPGSSQNAPGSETSSSTAGRQRTVTLVAVGHSGESGTAVFTEYGKNTSVSVRMTGAPKGIAQPTAIVLGDCATAAGDTKWALPSVIDGKADTTLGAKFDDLFTPGAISYSMRVQGSAVLTTAQAFAACGDLK